MQTLWQDLRYAARALGPGVNTAIFSVVNAVSLRPLPYTVRIGWRCSGRRIRRRWPA
jgi:hypothetical protein